MPDFVLKPFRKVYRPRVIELVRCLGPIKPEHTVERFVGDPDRLCHRCRVKIVEICRGRSPLFDNPPATFEPLEDS